MKGNCLPLFGACKVRTSNLKKPGAVKHDSVYPPLALEFNFHTLLPALRTCRFEGFDVLEFIRRIRQEAGDDWVALAASTEHRRRNVEPV